MATQLMERYRPLTIVLPRRPGLSAYLREDEATIGARCPDYPVPLALAALAGPLATTSANLYGEPTSVTDAHVGALFRNDVALVSDGGPCTGSPSTVIDCTGVQPRLLPEGRIPWSELQVLLGYR